MAAKVTFADHPHDDDNRIPDREEPATVVTIIVEPEMVAAIMVREDFDKPD